MKQAQKKIITALHTDQSVSHEAELVQLSGSSMQQFQQRAHQIRNQAFKQALNSIAGWIGSVWKVIQRYRQQRSSLAELAKMDQRMLQDIGLTQSDVERLIYGLTDLDALNQRRSAHKTGQTLSRNNKVRLLKTSKRSGIVVADETSLAKCG